MSAPQSESEFEDDMSAVSQVYSLRAGHTLTLQDYEAIQRWDEVSRRDQERATDAFHRGYEQGLTEGGGAEVADLKARIRKLSVDLAAERGLRKFAQADVDKLREAIKRIWQAEVYQDGQLANGVSIAMVKEIRQAAADAGLTEQLISGKQA